MAWGIGSLARLDVHFERWHMALTQDEIDVIIDPALDRIAAGKATFSPQTDVVTRACIRHYEQTRDSVLRSFQWPFATARQELSEVDAVTFTISPAPTSAWSVGDIIYGITSEATAEIISVTSSTVYVIDNKVGTFTDGETIINVAPIEVTYDGVLVTYDGDSVWWWDDSVASQVNCATGYPTETAITPIGYPVWEKQYDLPSDFLRAISVVEEDDVDFVDDDRWHRQGDYIVTNYTTLHLEYVKKITDPTEFEDLFVELLILRLAKKLINPLAGTASKQFKDELNKELKEVEGRARQINFQENNRLGRNDWNQAQWIA
jgi:hypothetical protein